MGGPEIDAMYGDDDVQGGATTQNLQTRDGSRSGTQGQNQEP